MSAFLRTTTSAARAAGVRAFSSSAPRPLARFTVIGNLADTPELRASSTGREYLRYSVASNTGTGENRKTSWWNVSCFENEGPRRAFFQSLPKGTLVAVEAEATMSSYVDSEGKPRQGLNLTQRNLEVLRRPYNPAAGEGEQPQ